ncbi:MAG: hypothetical protein IPJ07_23200 [Acidobacteria bacterium]|nr:hypothetical protein [Acidobacteriota bacterium]
MSLHDRLTTSSPRTSSARTIQSFIKTRPGGGFLSESSLVAENITGINLQNRDPWAAFGKRLEITGPPGHAAERMDQATADFEVSAPSLRRRCRCRIRHPCRDGQ